jgi:flagellar basal body rod protein FlgC
MNGVDGLLSRYPNVLVLIEMDKLMSDSLSVDSNSNTASQMKTACSAPA